MGGRGGRGPYAELIDTDMTHLDLSLVELVTARTGNELINGASK